jgi:hypothetical protein
MQTQLPSVERSPGLRLASSDMAAPSAAKLPAGVAAPVNPTAPVNPPAKTAPPVGVINNINPEVQAKARASMDAEMSKQTPDPLRGGSQVDNSQRDWTERKPAPEKVQEIPKEPLSKMLVDHIHAIWAASAKVVDIWYAHNPNQDPNQVKVLAQTRNQDPSAVPGTLAKSAMNYTPNRVEKTEASSNSSRPDTTP